jgi:serine/threonine-protein kinase
VAQGAELVGQTLFGKLRVVRVLGAGAMGVVYEVEHLLTKHRRALKVLHPELSRSGEAVARLVREAGAPGKIASPYVPETFDVGRLPSGATYVLQELLEGESLRARLDRERVLRADVACGIASELCEGLSYVHEAGILHRDLKPENVFLVANKGAGPSVKILDFGVMRVAAGDTFGALTAMGRVLGTPLYMAPEQLDGVEGIDARGDVYAVGVMLYEMLSGRLPFQAGDAMALLRAIHASPPSPISGLDPALFDVIARALHRQRDGRIATVSALREALSPFIAATRAERSSLLAAASPYLDERYELVRCIKSGGMGSVYEVIHRETRRRRALKLMLPAVVASEELRSRFRLEARVTADIDSEHLVETFDAGVDPATNTPFLVMELLRGEELAAHLATRGALPPIEALTYLSQAAVAIDKTHAHGVVHRDLKPENLFITMRDDGAPRIKILDFGIAKVLASNERTAAQTKGALGTPLYMAPEQFGVGDVTAETDRYALAHVAFTLLVGQPYWLPETREGMHAFTAKVMAGAKEPASARAGRASVRLPATIDPWFAKATSVDPSQRFASAASMIDELAAALGGAGKLDEALARTLVDGAVSATPSLEPLGVAMDRPPPRRARAWTMLSVVALSLGLAAFLFSRREPPAADVGVSSPAALPPPPTPTALPPTVDSVAVDDKAKADVPASSTSVRAPVRLPQRAATTAPPASAAPAAPALSGKKHESVF